MKAQDYFIMEPHKLNSNDPRIHYFNQDFRNVI